MQTDTDCDEEAQPASRVGDRDQAAHRSLRHGHRAGAVLLRGAAGDPLVVVDETEQPTGQPSGEDRNEAKEARPAAGVVNRGGDQRGLDWLDRM